MKAFDKCLDAVALQHDVIQKKDGYTVMIASGEQIIIARCRSQSPPS